MLTPDQRAERAEAILNDPIYQESLASLKQIYVNAFRKCVRNDDEGRWRYQVALDVIDGVENHLRSVLTLGTLSPKQGQEFQTDTIAKRITRIF